MAMLPKSMIDSDDLVEVTVEGWCLELESCMPIILAEGMHIVRSGTS
ncbi:hypothetical protein JCM19241_5506 [Vibrio ishigakensis]|uniref:Uncharacterized protein n=1 Tax=Vibrio ishigakensis TaxID=1481914 RepID=A0A0B8Q3W4_9VIBR|nr:hypothetical protein JCM19241_5506 [Vibrio ishigakensis]